MKKKVVSILLAATLVVSMFAGCGAKENTDANAGADSQATVEENVENGNQTAEAAGNFDASELISVYSREDGSGTRGAFIELFGIEQKNDAGEKVDYTTVEAIITNSTDVMMTSVAGDTYGIGYVSLGSLNETVKAVKIDGVEATVDNINSFSQAFALMEES